MADAIVAPNGVTQTRVGDPGHVVSYTGLLIRVPSADVLQRVLDMLNARGLLDSAHLPPSGTCRVDEWVGWKIEVTGA